MKRRFLIIAIFAILFFVIYSFYNRNQGLKDALSTKEATNVEATIPAPSKTNLATDSAVIAVEQNKQLARMGVTPDMTEKQKDEKLREWSFSEASRLVPEQKQIGFYGKVVDQQLQGVPGAQVHFVLSTTASASGTIDSDIVSSNDGAFSLTSGTGSGINIHVSKEGYYEAKSLNENYFDSTGNGSSQNNPVLFHLHKRGTGGKLITSRYGVNPFLDFSAPRDGTPVWVDFLSRTVGSTGQMEVSQVKPPKEAWKTPTDWSYTLTIPDGGFIEENDEFPFDAPQSGYQSTIQFQFRAGQTNWTDTIDRHYYIKFGNPPKFGRIHVWTRWLTDTSLEYGINPDGSTNLEDQQ